MNRPSEWTARDVTDINLRIAEALHGVTRGHDTVVALNLILLRHHGIVLEVTETVEWTVDDILEIATDLRLWLTWCRMEDAGTAPKRPKEQDPGSTNIARHLRKYDIKISLTEEAINGTD